MEILERISTLDTLKESWHLSIGPCILCKKCYQWKNSKWLSKKLQILKDCYGKNLVRTNSGNRCSKHCSSLPRLCIFLVKFLFSHSQNLVQHEQNCYQSPKVPNILAANKICSSIPLLWSMKCFENFCYGLVKILIFHKPFSVNKNQLQNLPSQSSCHQVTSTLLVTFHRLSLFLETNHRIC